MSAYEAYKEYVALKSHFNKHDYDYIKYGGKIGISPASFEKRKDKIFFEKLSKKENIHDFLVANLSHNRALWAKPLAYDESSDKTYLEWKKRKQALSYHFKNDLNKLHPKFNKNLDCKDGHPILFKTYLGGEICLETMCIILDLTEAIGYWDSQMEYDPVWDEYKTKIVKYTPFIQYDKDKFKKILLDFFSE